MSFTAHPTCQRSSISKPCQHMVQELKDSIDLQLAEALQADEYAQELFSGVDEATYVLVSHSAAMSRSSRCKAIVKDFIITCV